MARDAGWRRAAGPAANPVNPFRVAVVTKGRAPASMRWFHPSSPVAVVSPSTHGVVPVAGMPARGARHRRGGRLVAGKVKRGRPRRARTGPG